MRQDYVVKIKSDGRTPADEFCCVLREAAREAEYAGDVDMDIHRSDTAQFYISLDAPGKAMVEEFLNTLRKLADKAEREHGITVDVGRADYTSDDAPTVQSDGGTFQSASDVDAPSYQVKTHKQAKSELQSIPDQPADEIRARVKACSQERQPTELPYCKQMKEANGLFRIRVDGYRAICLLDKPALRVLAVASRSRIYDKTSLALKRAGL